MLRDIKIKAVYDSEKDNILEDFYIPALSNSISYDRAVGYFDSKMLISAARGLSVFINNNGYMRLICGDTINEDEHLAIKEGYGEREIRQRIENDFYEIIKSCDSDLFQHQLKTLTWMIKNSKLDVKIALRRNGIHHQKTGIFRDSNGDFIVFQGSANETNNALLPYNFETINVFKGWQLEFKDHFEPHMESFTNLWNNMYKNTLVINITDISLKVISDTLPALKRPNIEKELMLWENHLSTFLAQSENKNGPAIPKKINGLNFALKQHQKDALNKWKENNFIGIFELATGAGKTITAIYGAIKMYESRKRLLMVITVPYQNLADQWAENLLLFNIRPIICYGGEDKWRENLDEIISNFNIGNLNFVAVIVVDATLASRNGTFSNIIKSLDPKFNNYFLFIGDECHHHGADKIRRTLPLNANLRIGLSATPDRGEEDEGNKYITEYYGEVISQYTLKDALDDNVLTPYEYYLVPVQLTNDETEKYIAFSKQIYRMIAIIKNSTDKSNQIKNLNMTLLKRARLINGSVNKLKALRELLSNLKPIKHSLFYCAEGKLDDGTDQDEDEGIKQIQIISSILHEHGWRSSQFTANENKTRREQILKEFKSGDIDSLVAMKCLDEGVDIAKCSTAFILSSTRKPRQFIQRRGRILRKSPGKTKAVIYDFFVTLPLDDIEEMEFGRKLLIAELKRINEFASLSKNKAAAYKMLQVYLKHYDLHHYIYC